MDVGFVNMLLNQLNGLSEGEIGKSAIFMVLRHQIIGGKVYGCYHAKSVAKVS